MHAVDGTHVNSAHPFLLSQPSVPGTGATVSRHTCLIEIRSMYVSFRASAVQQNPKRVGKCKDAHPLALHWPAPACAKASVQKTGEVRVDSRHWKCFLRDLGHHRRCVQHE